MLGIWSCRVCFTACRFTTQFTATLFNSDGSAWQTKCSWLLQALNNAEHQLQQSWTNLAWSTWTQQSAAAAVASQPASQPARNKSHVQVWRCIKRGPSCLLWKPDSYGANQWCRQNLLVPPLSSFPSFQVHNFTLFLDFQAWLQPTRGAPPQEFVGQNASIKKCIKCRLLIRLLVYLTKEAWISL